MPSLNVIYADAALLVVDKPAGLLSVPGKGDGQMHNLTTQLGLHHPEARVVHRLDQATSGLMLFGLGAQVQRALSMAFEARQIYKRYEAVVTGLVLGDDGVIDAPLMADWPRRPRQKVDLAQGKPATTRWRLLQRGATTTRLELEPITGRSHQLRVHLLSIGHPILGDRLYGDASADASERMHLHATRLTLNHPLTQVLVSFDSPAPF